MDIVKKIVYKVMVNGIAPITIIPSKFRKIIYNKFGMIIEGSIFSSCYFETNLIRLGKNSFINKRCRFDNNCIVDIGDNCAIGHEVSFCTVTHEIGNCKKRAGNVKLSGIKIEDGCWIGTRTTILPGVKVGKGCVIAAGSVVIKDCEENSLYGGVPAKKIRNL